MVQSARSDYQDTSAGGTTETDPNLIRDREPEGPSLSDVLRGAQPNHAQLSSQDLDNQVGRPDVEQGRDTEGTVAKAQEPNEGTTNTIKHLYEGPEKCRCCINWVEEYPDDLKDSASNSDESKAHAIVLRHQKCHDESREKDLELHSIKIQSVPLKSALHEIFEDYPGLTPGLKHSIFEKPFTPFFYRWDTLLTHISKAKATGASFLKDLELLKDVIETELKDVFETYDDLIKNHVMSFKYLWTLYPPKSLVVEPDREQNGRYRAYEVIEAENETSSSGDSVSITARYVDWNGEKYGYMYGIMKIPLFRGTRKITELRLIPIDHHPNKPKVLEDLYNRGDKVQKLKDAGHRAYHGTITVADAHSDRKALERRSVEGRIYIDPKTFFRYNRDRPLYYKPLDDDEADLELCESDKLFAEDHLLDRDRSLLCNPELRGYCLTTKEWALFDVEEVCEIEWNEEAIQKLVISESRKKLLLAMANQQKVHELKFDDVIKGKGRGLVMLLTGNPGTGKTLTAESIADYLHLPLYSLSAGHLGEELVTIEENLKIAFEIAAHWKAVLLLDEADVFMEERSTSDLSRNRLVAIFLRMLEYYQGTLILTTNRSITFDSAFQSRIHLTLNYPELDASAKKRIWGNFLQMTKTKANEADLEALSKTHLNGRQIKNVVKLAQLLAHSGGKAMEVGHINEVIAITEAESNISRE